MNTDPYILYNLCFRPVFSPCARARARIYALTELALRNLPRNSIDGKKMGPLASGSVTSAPLARSLSIPGARHGLQT